MSDLQRTFLPSFDSIGQVVSEEKILKNRPIRNKNCLWRPCLLTDRDKMSNLYRGPSIDASYQISVHSAKRFQRRRFLEIHQSEKKNCLWRLCVLMNRDEMSNLQRGHSKDTPQHVSIHLAKRFQRRRIFRNQPIRNKNGLWRPCLSTHRDEMSNLYRGSAIDTSQQVSVHLAKRCQRRFLKIGQSETRIAYGGHVC